MWNLFVIRKENLLESRSPWPGRLRDSSNGLWEILTFKPFPRIINVYNQRKRWRVNFQDHHRSASRNHVKYQAQAIWNNSSNNYRWGQEEGMDVATAMLDWKTVVFFFSKSVNRWRVRVLRARSAWAAASFQTFCLTASAYLNTQKYGLFCSLRQYGRKVWDH